MFLRRSQLIVWLAGACLLLFAFYADVAYTQTLPRLDTEEQAFITLINAYRAQNGLVPLQVSVTLTNAAKWMSQDMASHNNFSHIDTLRNDPLRRLATFGYSYATWKGENIAAGNSSASATFSQWKNSLEHNQNMLNPNYRVIGVGRVYGMLSTYKYYWTTDFGGYVDQVMPGVALSSTPTLLPTPTSTPTPSTTPIPKPAPTPNLALVPIPTPAQLLGSIPDAKCILAGPPDAAGNSIVQGFTGAVPGSSQVTITNTATSVSNSTTASADGSFQTIIRALAGQRLAIRFSVNSATSDSISILTFSPTITGVTPTIGGSINDMAISGSYGYIPDPVGLRVVDLSTPSHPQVVGTLITKTKPTGVEVVGQYVFLTAAYSSNALQVIDVSNKTKPRLVASLLPSSGGSCIRIKVKDGRTLAFIGGYFDTRGPGVQVVDVTQPLAPITMGFTKFSRTPQAITVADRYAYTVSYGQTGIQVLDVSNPNSPFFVTQSSEAIGYGVKLVLVQTGAGDTIAIPTNTGLKLLNVSNPAAPVLINTALSGYSLYGVDSAGGSLVAVGAGYPYYGLLMLDLSSPAYPRLLGSLHSTGICGLVRVGAGLALIAAGVGTESLNVIDVRSSTQPVKLGGLTTFSQITTLALQGNAAVVNGQDGTAGRSMMVWANNQNPKLPVITAIKSESHYISATAFSESGQWLVTGANDGLNLQVIESATQSVIGSVRLPFGDRVSTIKLRGNLAYVAGEAGGLLIFDLGITGRAPSVIGSVNTTGTARGVEVVGNYAYVAADSTGVQVIDVSNPFSPKLVGVPISTDAPALSLRAQGKYLYLTKAGSISGGSNGLVVFDLTNPARPVIISTLTTAGYAFRLDVVGNLVYIASGGAGLTIIDSRNPYQPVVATVVKTFGYCRDVKASGGLVYLADDYAVQAIVSISPSQ